MHSILSGKYYIIIIIIIIHILQGKQQWHREVMKVDQIYMPIK